MLLFRESYICGTVMVNCNLEDSTLEGGKRERSKGSGVKKRTRGFSKVQLMIL